EDQLEVGRRRIRTDADERRRLGDIGCQRPPAGDEPREQMPQAFGGVERLRVDRGEGAVGQVVAEISADAGGYLDDGDAVAGELFSCTDPGEQEQPRRVARPSGKDDLAVRVRLLLVRRSALEVRDAACAA